MVKDVSKQDGRIGQDAIDENKRRPMRFIEESVKTQYAKIFNIGFGQDEVVFVFGNPSFDPNAIQIESKTAVSLKTAKRMALALSNLVRQYEAKNGTILMEPGQLKEEKTKVQ